MLEAIDIKEYYNNIISWLADRGMSTPDPEDFPNAGFVYSMDGIPTAVGFLRMVEGRQGRIDYLISNPHQSPSHRDEAVQEVSKALIQLAKSLKLKHIYAHTQCGNTKSRSQNLGFQEFPHSLIALDLRSEAK